VPQGTACSVECHQSMNYDGTESRSCYCRDWTIKSTLFRGGSAADFLCQTVAGDSSPGSAKACLSHDDQYSQQVPNIDDLNEYYEYHTGVPARWTDSDTIWLESVPVEGEPTKALKLEPPLQLTLEVPSNHAPSLSGLSYAGKKVVVTFSSGIDIYNSPGFPMWCLNRASGANRAPISDQGGNPQCIDWASVDYSTFDWENDHYDLYPDVNPDLSWAGVDGKNLNWGLKPAEKTIIYSRVADSNCSGTGSIDNPVTLASPGDVPDLLEEPTRRMREALVELKAWYREHKDDADHIRVHTGSFVGAAATNATNDFSALVEEVGSG